MVNRLSLRTLSFLILICSQVVFCQTADTQVTPDLKGGQQGLAGIVYPQKVTFDAADDLPITADIYQIDDTSACIVLCHQAGYSRGEYVESAKRFNKLGFNCVAIDQRSGYEVNGVYNETAKTAIELGKKTSYLEAEHDIVAAINYSFSRYKQRIILLGSSYSASLALKIANDNALVKAVIAFSPGEHFGTKLNLADAVRGLNKPVFVTSSGTEIPVVENIMSGVISSNKVLVFPKGNVSKGSKVLWKEDRDDQEYWLKMIGFLGSIRGTK